MLVRADNELAATAAGQHFLSMLINLLARQFGVIDHIWLDVPDDLPAIVWVLGGSPDAPLRRELFALTERISGPEIIPCELLLTRRTKAACSVVLGPQEGEGFTVHAGAAGWDFSCSTQNEPFLRRTTSSNPIGPYLAACFAAAAVFKFLTQLNPAIELRANAWNAGMESKCSVPPDVEGLSLPTAYLVGAGAVGTACAVSLAAMPNVSGRLIALDYGSSDETNRNRLITQSYDALAIPKVDLLSPAFDSSSLKYFPYKGAWPDYTVDPLRKIPDDIRAREREDRFEWMLSCVDKNYQRRRIAKFCPRHIIGGSTYGMTAQVSYFSMLGNCECLGCRHPAVNAASTEEVEAELRQMSRNERDDWYTAHDCSVQEREAIEEYLSDPGCGTIGAAHLSKLGREGETDWSVGFVSVAAGVLQATAFIRSVIEGPPTLEAGSEIYAWFLPMSLGRARALRRNCDICASKDARSMFPRLWPE